MSGLSREIAQAALSPVEDDSEGWFGWVLRFSTDFSGFRGHFPDYPIVPAVAQVLAAQRLAETRLAENLHLQAVERAKFLLELRPEQEVTVRCRLKFRGEETLVEARLSCERGLAASFVLQYAPERLEG